MCAVQSLKKILKKANTHTHTIVYQGNGAEGKAFKKRKIFKEDLKELTEVEWTELRSDIIRVVCRPVYRPAAI